MKHTTRLYEFGFLFSLLLTFSAYLLVVNNVLSGIFLLGTLLTLAVLQLFVQLIFFLHMGSDSKPHWNLVFFFTTFALILLIIIGSLVIMFNLSYRHNLSPSETQKTILQDEGIQK